MLTIVASLEQELTPLRKALKSGRAGLPPNTVAGGLHVIGVGRTRATASLRSLLGRRGDEEVSEDKVRRILMLGFAGAVEPTLKLGDLVLSSRYYKAGFDEAENGFLEPDQRMWQAACGWAGDNTKTWSQSDSLTVDSIVESVREKSEMRSAYPVGIVDMEDYWIAATAGESGVPFLSARVVLDEAHQALPGYLVNMTGSSVKAAANVALMPWRLPAMVGLARRLPVAQQSLTEFALGFIGNLEEIVW